MLDEESLSSNKVCSEVGLLVHDTYAKHLLHVAAGKCSVYINRQGEKIFKVGEERLIQRL